MSQYVTPETIADEIGGWARLNDALDDDGDGQVETGLLDRLIASASGAVDGFLQGRYVTPFNPAPAIVAEATLIFAIEKIYNRRKQGPNEKNPYEERATEMRRRLKRIADREESLNAEEREAFRPGAIIFQESRLNGSTL
ncbi:MAG TPA: phage protein Gp36 family protein [Verrucomicrobiae bacterium]|jgi:phage gp36-like protein